MITAKTLTAGTAKLLCPKSRVPALREYEKVYLLAATQKKPGAVFMLRSCKDPLVPVTTIGCHKKFDHSSTHGPGEPAPRETESRTSIPVLIDS